MTRLIEIRISYSNQPFQVNILLHLDNTIRLTGSGGDWRRVDPIEADGQADLFSRMGVLESLAWAAPESMMKPMKPTPASDIYSFACVCVEVST